MGLSMYSAMGEELDYELFELFIIQSGLKVLWPLNAEKEKFSFYNAFNS